MIILVSVFAFVVLMLLVGSAGWSNVLSPARNELVFADRNREYGAYVIRQEHHRIMFMAFLAAMGLVASALFVPRLFQADPSQALPEDLSKVVIFDMIAPALPDVPKAEPDPPAKQQPSDPDLRGGVIAVDSSLIAPLDTATIGPVDLGKRTDTTGTGDPTTSTKGSGSGGDPSGSGGTGPFEAWQADEAPSYPGGEIELYRYLKNETRYPEIARASGKQGRVVIDFVVDVDGTVTSAKVIMSVSPAIDAEALRVVRNMVKWNPGKFKGKNVPVRFKLPIVFTMQKS